MTAHEDTCCWICSTRDRDLEHHSTTTVHGSTLSCSAEQGQGISLCPACHRAVHAWMRTHHDTTLGAANRAPLVLLERLSHLIDLHQPQATS